jgi:hypothetical protein
LEGSGRGLIEVLACYLPGQTDENHENLKKTGVPAETRNNVLWNTFPEHSYYINPLAEGDYLNVCDHVSYIVVG